MRRRIIVVFFSCFLSLALPASALQRGALFKVTAAGHSMLLFGTMHVGLPEFYPLEPRLAQAIANASTLALLKPWVVATVLGLNEYTALGYRADLAVATAR